MDCITIQGMAIEPAVNVNRIDRMMESRGWGPGELQYQSGVTYDTIYKIRTGTRPRTSAEILGKLAVALGCSVDWLIGLTDDPRPVDTIIGQKETLQAMSQEGLKWAAIFEKLPDDDQKLIESMMLRLDERRQLVEDVRVAQGLVDIAGRLGGEGARELARQVMDGDVTIGEALAEVR